MRHNTTWDAGILVEERTSSGLKKHDLGPSIRRNLLCALSARLDSLVHSLRICNMHSAVAGVTFWEPLRSLLPVSVSHVARQDVSTHRNNDSDVSELHIDVFSLSAAIDKYFIFRFTWAEALPVDFLP